MSNQTNLKTNLETSKERLAKAFQMLENIIEKQLKSNSNGSFNFEKASIESDLRKMSDERKKLEISYTDIYDKYASIKSLNLEVVTELNSSINYIEELLDSNHANISEHND